MITTNDLLERQEKAIKEKLMAEAKIAVIDELLEVARANERASQMESVAEPCEAVAETAAVDESY
jgi:uncharacterized tellurite resistance protein B-like protein